MRNSIILLMLLLVIPVHAFADNGQGRSGALLLGAYFKTEKLISAAEENIGKLRIEISKNNNTIINLNGIISKASGRIDQNAKQAERVAREALQQAKIALLKNENSLREWELDKTRAEKSKRMIYNLLSKGYDREQGVTGIVAEFSGEIDIIKKNGNIVDSELSLIETGDEIRTADNITEVQVLEGRGTIIIGQNSRLMISDDSDEKQAVALSEGKAYLSIDKVDEYMKGLNDFIKEYKDAPLAIEESWKNMKEKIRHWSEKQFELKTPTAICAVRGTRFIVEVKDKDISQIAVLEGAVEVINIKEGTNVVVEKGYSVTCENNQFIKQEKTGNIEKWWEKRQEDQL